MATRLLVLFLSSSLTKVYGVDNSLSACHAFATHFHNTCDDTDGDGYVDAASSVAAMTGQTISSSAVEKCPGTDTDSNGAECTWVRKLCVSCTTESGVTRIRVQSNNFPTKTGVKVPGDDGYITEKDIDFKVNFRTAVASGRRGLNIQISTSTDDDGIYQDAVNDAICDAQAAKTSNIPTDNDYEEIGEDAHGATFFIALTGVVSWTTSSKDSDAFLPPASYKGVTLESEGLDNCLAHATTTWLHYHSMTTAIWSSEGDTCISYQPWSMFDDDGFSVTDLMFDGISPFGPDTMDDYKDGRLWPIGIALDGHPVYSPWIGSNKNTLDGDGLDLCNGILYDDDGDNTDDAYAYFTSAKFPYQTGCYGPASYPEVAPECTANPKDAPYTRSTAIKNAIEAAALISGAAPTPKPSSAPVAAPTSATPPPTSASGNPNIVIVQFDDAIPEWFRDWEADVSPPDLPDDYKYDNTDFLNFVDDGSLPYMESVREAGISFTRAYTVTSSCAPSRFGILTGRYPSRGEWATTRSANNYGSTERTFVNVASAKLDGVDSEYNMAALLKSKGYYTGVVGKWHLTTGNEVGSSFEDDFSDQQTAIMDRGFTFADGFYVGNFNECTDSWCSEFNHNQDWITTEAVRFMSEAVADTNSPFFLYFNPTVPHTPDVISLLTDGYCADESTTGCDATTTPSATRSQGGLSSRPSPSTYCSASACQLPTYTELYDEAVSIATISLGTARDTLITEVASALWVDKSIGALLGFLGEEAGRLENTFFLVTSDNGEEKNTLYEMGLRTFLFARYTRGGIVPGSTSDALVSNVDILPTFIDFTFGLNDPDLFLDFDGASWKDVALGTASTVSGREYLVFEANQNRGVIRDDYMKYIELDSSNNDGCDDTSTDEYPYCADTQQLYNLETDGAEQDNIATSRASVVNAFSSILAQHDSNTIDAVPIAPTRAPTAAPTSCYAPDEATYTTAQGRDCVWVGENDRCDFPSRDPASNYCLNACGTCPDDSGSGQGSSSANTTILLTLIAIVFGLFLALMFSFIYWRHTSQLGDSEMYTDKYGHKHLVAATVYDLQEEQEMAEDARVKQGKIHDSSVAVP